VAREFGLDPWEVERRWSHRQLVLVQEWLQRTPSRIHAYLAQLALYTVAPNTDRQFTIEDFLIIKRVAELTPEQEAENRKNLALAMAATTDANKPSMTIEHRRISKEEAKKLNNPFVRAKR
jgi:hypothetical protein